MYLEKKGIPFHSLRRTYAVCGFDMLVHNSPHCALDLTNKCYVMGVPLRCENEECKLEITGKEGEAGKKGLSDWNVENTSHIEVIMIPQKSECNLNGLVESGWQSTCVRGRTLDVDNIFRTASASQF